MVSVQLNHTNTKAMWQHEGKLCFSITFKRKLIHNLTDLRINYVSVTCDPIMKITCLLNPKKLKFLK